MQIILILITSTAMIPPSDALLIETLVHIEQGRPTTEAVRQLGITVDDFLAVLEHRPELVEAAEQRARALASDPNVAIESSISGLNLVALRLKDRLLHQHEDFAPADLVRVGTLMSQITGVATQRKLELEAEVVEGRDEPRALLIQDRRPNPVTGEARLALFVVPVSSPAWVDTRKPEFRPPAFNWLEIFAPLDPTTGRVRDVPPLLEAGVRLMDEHGEAVNAA